MARVKPGAEWFRNVCMLNRLPVSDEQLDRLEKYVDFLLEWNQKINLISRNDQHKVWGRHVLHSVAFLFHRSLIERPKIVDIGAGGGLPGIPLQILVPQMSLTLIDSIRKKTIALREIVHQLSLIDVRVECGRAEELGSKEEFFHQFDYVLARAVGTLDHLATWSSPFLRRATHKLRLLNRTGEETVIAPPALIALKGGELDKEIALAKKHKNVGEIKVINLTIRGLDQTHNLERKAVIVHFN